MERGCLYTEFKETINGNTFKFTIAAFCDFEVWKGNSKAEFYDYKEAVSYYRFIVKEAKTKNPKGGKRNGTSHE